MLTVIVGPMFSGKTTELLRCLDRYALARKRAVLVRPTCDTREFLSHGGRGIENLETIWQEKLNIDSLLHYDVVGIDEGQMFPELFPYISILALSGTQVIVSALNMTSEGQPFETVLLVMNYADELIKLNAICAKCGNEYATMTFYKGDEKKENILLVGGADIYEARCLKCWCIGDKKG